MIEFDLGDMDPQRIRDAINRAKAIGGYLRMSTKTLDAIKRMEPSPPTPLSPWEHAARLLNVGAVSVVADDRLPFRIAHVESRR